MTVKLLGGRDESGCEGDCLTFSVDQLVMTQRTLADLGSDLGRLERVRDIDLIVAYDPFCTRRPGVTVQGPEIAAQSKRLGIVLGRPGIGYPAAVHLERCASPSKVVVSDAPQFSLLGGLGMLSIPATPSQIASVISNGKFRWAPPQVVQILLSGRLSACVTARDVGLELVRLGVAERVRAVASATSAPVVLEFSGPGLRSLGIPERALLCAMAPTLGAASAVAACDEKSELYLRDQRRSKAYRQLSPDAGAPCAEVVCLDLSTVVPLVAMGNGPVLQVAELANTPVREVVIGGASSSTLRDLLGAVAWFKSKRISSDVDVVVAPASRQTFESLAMNGALTQLLSGGVRFLEPDERLLDGEWHPPPADGLSLRSFGYRGATGSTPNNWGLASIDTLCMSAISGALQDPRATRKAQRLACPRELPIDDSLLFDKKPSTSATLPPPRSPSEPVSRELVREAVPDPVTSRRPLGEPRAWS